MNDMRECSACDRIAYDVGPRIVELPDGTYAMELRCANPIECLERVEASLPAPSRRPDVR